MRGRNSSPSVGLAVLYVVPWTALVDTTVWTSGTAVGVGSGGDGGEQSDGTTPKVVGKQTAPTVAVAKLVEIDLRDPTSIVVANRGGPELKEKFGRQP
jgi:hypothetical protein